MRCGCSLLRSKVEHGHAERDREHRAAGYAESFWHLDKAALCWPAHTLPHPVCSTSLFFFFTPPFPFFNDKNVSKNNWPPLSPQSIRHREGELTQFRSLGFQTANKTAVTRAPLAGCNAFQSHRKEAVRVSLGLEWGGTVTTACSPPVSLGQRLPHSRSCIMCVCFSVTVTEGNVT